MSNFENFKVIEVPRVNCKQEELVSPIISEVLSDIPLIQADVRIFSESEFEFKNIPVEKKDLESEENCLVAIIPDGSIDKQVSTLLFTTAFYVLHLFLFSCSC